MSPAAALSLGQPLAAPKTSAAYAGVSVKCALSYSPSFDPFLEPPLTVDLSRRVFEYEQGLAGRSGDV
jgi:hypothetical protein